MNHELNYKILRMHTVVGVWSVGIHYKTTNEYYIAIIRTWSNIMAEKKKILGDLPYHDVLSKESLKEMTSAKMKGICFWYNKNVAIAWILIAA